MIRIPALLFAVLLVPTLVFAQGTSRSLTFKPQYVPPAELEHAVGARERGGRALVEWQDDAGEHVVEIRRNDSANLMVLLGTPGDLAAVEALAKAADIAPHQIAIEARIVELDRTAALNAGLDWTMIQTSFQGRATWSSRRFTTTSKSTELLGQGGLEWSQMLRLLEERGVATTRNAPTILTLNNREATILDGQRVTYVTRYSSYTNLYATDSLDAGLRLNVRPSLGESGYLTLGVRAELTSIVNQISGSPVKDGQMVENTVVVRDGETVLLGGFTRTHDIVTRRGFPGLGRILPFLFSREIRDQSVRESFVAITPHVVDLNAKIDDETQKKLEGR